MLVWPGSESKSLKELCNHLDSHDEEALFCSFLDMYSDKPLDETIYSTGENFIDICPYYENDSYSFNHSENAPYIGIYGGPRAKDLRKKFVWSMMKKVPLVKWKSNFSLYSTHSYTSNIKVSA